MFDYTAPTHQRPQAGRTEFILIMGMLMSLVALSIDSILPALGAIDADFALTDDNARQLVVPALFSGFVIGQVIFGPLGDRYGRKPMIWVGLAVLVVGTLVSVYASTFAGLLIGRVLQGLGVAAPRVLSVAIIRDRFSGAEMARVMSLVIMIFLFAPIFAPAFGQAVLWLFPWRAVLWATALVGFIGIAWLQLRQPETLANPVPIRISTLAASFVAVVTNPLSLGYTLAGAAVYAGLMGYIISSQQIYQELYGVGDSYVLIMGAAGAVVALALLLNHRLTKRYALQTICKVASAINIAWTVSFLTLTLVLWDGLPPLWSLLLLIAGTQFLLGLVFGNLAAIALEPLGHIAGSATAIQSATMTGIAIFAAGFIGSQLGDTVTPILWGYAVSAVLTLVFMLIAGWLAAQRGSKIDT